ncbi:MAG: hypothetical protein ACRDXX_14190 [Stackebrandtia sp.]
MIRPAIGVMGPADLVDPVAATAEETGRAPVTRIPYRHEAEAPRLVERHRDEVDAWLFTGIVPHTIAESEKVLDRPAEHVSYSGVTLLSVIVRLLSKGRAVRALSVDTLDANEVRETLRAAGLTETECDVLKYRNGQTSRQVVDFHREAHERFGPDATALVCLGSAYAALREEIHAVRVAPSRRDVREAVESLLLKAQSRHYSDAQVAVGFAAVDGDRAILDPLLGELGASSFALDDGRVAFVTTRGPLWSATREFTRLPRLAALAEAARAVHIGIGIGRSAAEAEALAHTAWGRARDVGPVGAALAQTNEAPRILEAPAATPDEAPVDLRRLASRAGVSKKTLLAVRRLADSREAGEVTAQDVAEAFGMHDRSARRLVKQLERAGLAAPVGRRISGPGRPTVVYALKW